MTTPETERDRAKEARRRELVSAAAHLFAQRGFAAVSLADLGAAVGVSGPAVYRHFAGKQALLDELLVGVSARLESGGRSVVSAAGEASTAVHALVAFHVQFALESADVIRVQDRDLAAASVDARRTVRRLQTAYADEWVRVLGLSMPDLSEVERRLRVHACFGLINSTPHSVRASRELPRDATATVLAAMALAALTAL